MHDSTKTYEELLRENEIFRSLFENATIGICRIDADGRLLTGNPALARIMGYASCEDMSADAGDFGGRIFGSPEAYRRELHRLAGQNSTQNLELETRRRDGATRLLSADCRTIGDAKGIPLFMEGFIADITEQRRIREELQSVLREQRIILDTADVAISLVRDRKQVWINKKTEAMFQYPKEELIGQTTEKFYVSKEAYNRLGSDAYPVLARGETYVTVQELVRRDGAHIWVKYNGRAVDPSDLSAGTLWILEDITERKRTEEALQRAHDDLEQRVRDRTEALTRLNEEFKDEIADRRRAEEALKTREEIFSSIVGQAVDAIALIDRTNDRFVEFNEAAHEGLGYSREEFAALTVHDIRTEMTPEPISRILEEDPVRGVAFETTHRHRSGDIRDVRVSVKELRIGGRAYWAAVWTDITDQKRAERDLQYRNVLLSTQQDVSIDGILVVDEEDRIVSYNRRFVDMWRIQPALVEAKYDEPVLQSVASQIADPDQFQERVRYLYEHKEEIGRDVIALVDGRVFERYSAPLLGPEGQYFGRVWYFHDLTDFIRAEEALRESGEMLKTIFDNSPIAVEIYDKEAVLIGCNRRVGEMFGVDADALIGKFGLKDDPNYGYRDIWERLDRGEEVRQIIPVDFARLPYETRKTGTAFYDIITTPIPDTVSRKIGYIVQIIDVTERMQAQADRESLQAQFLQAQKMESVGRLAGGVAHDFNNMLGVILGHTEIVMERVKPGQPFRTNLEEIAKAARRSTALVSQLLAFARKQTAAPRLLDLNETVDGMLKMLQRLIGEDIHLNWLPGSDLWTVLMDPSQIDQILANLCVNARDAIAGVGRVAIETGNVAFDEDYCSSHAGYIPGAYVLLAVSDDGCGMSRETLANIFDPFFTTKETGKGTGLGLATIYGIVKQNGGFVGVDSEPGRGTTFKVYLPRYMGAEEPAAAGDSREPAAGGRETVLVVEDEPSLLAMSGLMLEKLGYAVLIAGTPGEAVRKAEAHAGTIHLLMTDVVMPEMNGKELADRLKVLFPDMKSLFMSGYTADIISHHGILNEGVHYMQKPFSLKEMASKVRKALDGA